MSPRSLPAATTGQNTLLETPGELNSILGPSFSCTRDCRKMSVGKPPVSKRNICTAGLTSASSYSTNLEAPGAFYAAEFLSSLHNSVPFLRHQSQQRFPLEQARLPPEQCQAWGHTWPRSAPQSRLSVHCQPSLQGLKARASTHLPICKTHTCNSGELTPKQPKIIRREEAA